MCRCIERAKPNVRRRVRRQSRRLDASDEKPPTPSARFRSRAAFLAVYGAPVHIGDPSLIGIRDLSRPDFGDAVDIHDDELPVFWACGVIPQAAIESARLPFAIAHKPGHMLVTDILNTTLAVI